MHLAWKKALEEKEFDFYLWLNDDTVLFPDAIFTMMDTFQKCGEDSIICGSTKSELTGNFTYGLRIKKGIELVPNGEIQYGEFMNGNVVLISKSIYEAIGIIDNIYPHAIGDNDYGLRAVKNGIRIATPVDYIGYCEGHDKLPAWCLPEVPFKKRLKSLYSPLGNSHPRYFFIFEYRHFGLTHAIKHFYDHSPESINPFIMEMTETFVFQADDPVVLNEYNDSNNYLIEFTPGVEKTYCALYFSSHSVYNPNDEEAFNGMLSGKINLNGMEPGYPMFINISF